MDFHALLSWSYRVSCSGSFTFDFESHCVHVIFFLCHRYDLYLYSLLLALKKEGRLYRLRRWSKPSDEGVKFRGIPRLWSNLRKAAATISSLNLTEALEGCLTAPVFTLPLQGKRGQVQIGRLPCSITDKKGEQGQCQWAVLKQY